MSHPGSNQYRFARSRAVALRAPLPVLAFAASAVCGISQSPAQCYYTATPIPNAPGGWYCFAWDINNHGWVVGEATTGGENTRAFIWTPELGTRLLSLPPGVSSMIAYAINDLGHVAGTLEVP